MRLTETQRKNLRKWYTDEEIEALRLRATANEAEERELDAADDGDDTDVD